MASVNFRQWRRQRPYWGGKLLILAGIQLYLSGNLTVDGIDLHLGPQGFLSYLLPVILLVCGLLCWFSPAQRLFYGIVAILTALYSFLGLNLGGFVIGMLLGIVGGAMVIAWGPPRARPATAQPSERDHRVADQQVAAGGDGPADGFAAGRPIGDNPTQPGHQPHDASPHDARPHGDQLHGSQPHDEQGGHWNDNTAILPGLTEQDDSTVRRWGRNPKALSVAVIALAMTATFLVSGSKLPASADDCPPGLPSRPASAAASPSVTTSGPDGESSGGESSEQHGSVAEGSNKNRGENGSAEDSPGKNGTAAGEGSDGKDGTSGKDGTDTQEKPGSAAGTAAQPDEKAPGSSARFPGSTAPATTSAAEKAAAAERAPAAAKAPPAEKADEPGNPIVEGLRNLAGGVGNLLGINGDEPSPSASPTPSATAPAPDPAPTTAPAGEPGTSGKPTSSKPAGPSSDDKAGDDRAGNDKAGDDKAGDEKPGDGDANASPGPKATSSGPTAAPSASADEIPCLGARIYGKVASPDDLPAVAAKPGLLEVGTLTMYNSSYDGVVDVPTSDGGTIKSLKFSMRKAVNKPFSLTIDEPNGGQTVIKSNELTIDQNVRFYTPKFEGRLFGLIPVTFTPERPPPLTLPILTFTKVKVQLAYVRCDTLTADPLDLRETP